MTEGTWENHYHREKARLTFPDENLVRLIAKHSGQGSTDPGFTALDLGCGTGRHISLLDSLGFKRVIGMDLSFRALELCRDLCHPLVQNDNTRIPLRDRSIDLVIAWGSLHYNRKKDMKAMLGEISRILKTEGRLFATLRTDRDTCLRSGEMTGDNEWITDLNDISGSLVSFYSEEELLPNFSMFKSMEYGIMERSLMGNTSSIISHWIIHARA